MYISRAKISRRDIPRGVEVVATKNVPDVKCAQPARTIRDSGLYRLFNLEVPENTGKAGGTVPSESTRRSENGLKSYTADKNKQGGL
jgi:hypothetical protein